MDKVAGFATGTIDAYIYIDHKGTRLKTKVVTQDDDKKLRWDQQMLLPLELPLSNDKLVFNLYDSDTLSDDLVCSMNFSLKEILSKDSSRQIRKA